MVVRFFCLEQGATRKHIRTDLRPRSNAVQTKKRRHPKGKSTLGRLAALLAPCRPMRVCASLAPCQPPRIALARPIPIYEMASSRNAPLEPRNDGRPAGPVLIRIFSRRYLCELNCAWARRRLSAAPFNSGLRRSAASNSGMLSRGFPDARRANPRLL